MCLWRWLWRGCTGTSHWFTTSQMHTQTILVFLAIKLPENSNKILKTDLSKEMDFWKSFRKSFWFWKSIAQTGSTGRANLFACDFGKQGLVLIITSENELEISRPFYKGFYRKKSLKKGHEMHSGCLESKKGLIVKGNVSRQVRDCN